MPSSLQQAIAAIKTGDKASGRRLLAQVLQNERENATAWLLLSAVVDNPEQKRTCLEEALRIKPGHPQASAALAKMQPAAAPPPLTKIKTAPLRKPDTSRTPTAPLRNPPPPPPGNPSSTPLPSPTPLFADLEEDSDKLPDWMPPLELEQAKTTVFIDDEPEPTPFAAPSRERATADENDRVEIPAWMERLYNPSPKGSSSVRPFEPSSERSFWETPLAESSPAAWRTTEGELSEQSEPPAPEQEYPAWEVPWHEATQAQELTRQAQQPNIRRPNRRGYAWYDHWATVLGNQSVESFYFVLSDPTLSLRRAVSWMVAAYCLQMIAIYGLGSILQLPAATQGASGSLGFLGVILCAPFASLLAIPFFLLQVGVQQLGAKAVGGRGSYRQFAFALAAYQAPMLLINAIITLSPYLLMSIPFISQFTPLIVVVLLLGVILAGIRLSINAYRAVHEFGIWQAFAAMLAPGVIVLSLTGCVAFLLMRR